MFRTANPFAGWGYSGDDDYGHPFEGFAPQGVPLHHRRSSIPVEDFMYDDPSSYVHPGYRAHRAPPADRMTFFPVTSHLPLEDPFFPALPTAVFPFALPANGIYGIPYSRRTAAPPPPSDAAAFYPATLRPRPATAAGRGPAMYPSRAPAGYFYDPWRDSEPDDEDAVEYDPRACQPAPSRRQQQQQQQLQAEELACTRKAPAAAAPQGAVPRTPAAKASNNSSAAAAAAAAKKVANEAAVASERIDPRVHRHTDAEGDGSGASQTSDTEHDTTAPPQPQAQPVVFFDPISRMFYRTWAPKPSAPAAASKATAKPSPNSAKAAAAAATAGDHLPRAAAASPRSHTPPRRQPQQPQAQSSGSTRIAVRAVDDANQPAAPAASSLERQNSTALVPRPPMEVALSRGPSGALPAATPAAAAKAGDKTTTVAAAAAAAATAAAGGSAKPAAKPASKAGASAGVGSARVSIPVTTTSTATAAPTPAARATPSTSKMTRSQAARTIQRWWRGWRLWRHSSALRQLMAVAGALRDAASRFYAYMGATDANITDRQQLEINEMAMRVILRLDGMEGLPLEFRALRKHLTARALRLQDEVVSAYTGSEARRRALQRANSNTPAAAVPAAAATPGSTAAAAAVAAEAPAAAATAVAEKMEEKTEKQPEAPTSAPARGAPETAGSAAVGVEADTPSAADNEEEAEVRSDAAATPLSDASSLPLPEVPPPTRQTSLEWPPNPHLTPVAEEASPPAAEAAGGAEASVRHVEPNAADATATASSVAVAGGDDDVSYHSSLSAASSSSWSSVTSELSSPSPSAPANTASAAAPKGRDAREVLIVESGDEGGGEGEGEGEVEEPDSGSAASSSSEEPAPAVAGAAALSRRRSGIRPRWFRSLWSRRPRWHASPTTTMACLTGEAGPGADSHSHSHSAAVAGRPRKPAAAAAAAAARQAGTKPARERSCAAEPPQVVLKVVVAAEGSGRSGSSAAFEAGTQTE